MYYGEYIPYRQSNQNKCIKYSFFRIKQILRDDYACDLELVNTGYKGNRKRGFVHRYNMVSILTGRTILENVTLNALRILLTNEGYTLHDTTPKRNQGAEAFLDFVENIRIKKN